MRSSRRAFDLSAYLREWLADDVEIELVEGGRIEIGWDGGGGRTGTVETIEEPQRLVFRWRPAEPGPLDAGRHDE